MNYQDLKKAANKYRPVLLLEDHLPHYGRKRVLRFLFVFTVIFFFLSFGAVLVQRGLIDQSFNVLFFYQFKIRGIFFILFSVWIILHLLDSYFYSFYFTENGKGRGQKISFELATVIYHTSTNDLVAGLIHSNYGTLILNRLGITQTDLESFLKEREDGGGTANNAAAISTPILDLSDYSAFLYDGDKSFSEFLFSNRIDRNDLQAAAHWVESMSHDRMHHERWWSRENLGQIPGIGKTWAYGQIGLLKHYGYDLTDAFSDDDTNLRYNREEVNKLESILSRSREANAILINDNEAGNLTIASLLALEIRHGKALPELEHKRMFLLDTNALVSENKEKTALERELGKILNESIHAGNIILVIENLPGFLGSAQAIGSDIKTLLVPYLLSSSIQIVAFSDTNAFHNVLEPDRSLMQHFETLLITEKGDEVLIEVIEKEAVQLERRSGVFFTYQAVREIARDAKRYFNDIVLSDKAMDLLLELVPRAVQSGNYIIRSADVLDLVESKTGIPTGEVKEEEKDKLIHLEELLHRRIIGQDQAVVAVSQAMRRSRSGLENSHRPIGSFLFLGPTGVGKTETTKALNEAYFGGNSQILRLDMSEYSSSDALNKLIGSFEGNRAGVLSTMVREHPYGVLLLDEFEKTTSEVKNLFLQVLDEGSFKDMSGRNINAENLIIIATSNAGSDLIWDLFKAGGAADLGAAGKDRIVDQIIQQGIFKPELLNRFDQVILFHPLNETHLREVARLMLDAFRQRLLEKGVRLEITDDLIDFLIKIGMDPKFGARPMNRAIADKVEALIAEEMIKGNVKQGETIKIVREAGASDNLKVEHN